MQSQAIPIQGRCKKFHQPIQASSKIISLAIQFSSSIKLKQKTIEQEILNPKHHPHHHHHNHLVGRDCNNKAVQLKIIKVKAKQKPTPEDKYLMYLEHHREARFRIQIEQEVKIQHLFPSKINIVAQSERGSQPLMQPRGNGYQLSLGTQSSSGVGGVGRQPIGSISNQQRRNISGIVSSSSSSAQQQNHRSNQSQGIHFQENGQIFHENTLTNQIYNQEWEYRTFVHYFELLYHQIMLCLFSFLISCVFLYQVSYYFPLILFFIYDAISIVRSSYRLTLYTCYKSRVKCKIIILEILLIAATKILIMVYLKSSYFQSMYIMIPISVYCVIRLFVYKLEKKSEDCNSIINFFLLGNRLFIFLFSFSVCLKMDNVVSWDWQQTIWSYWIVFSVMIGTTFGSFLMMLSKLFQVCLQEAETYEIQGISWVFINIAGTTGGSCLFFLGIIQFLDSDNRLGLNIFNYYVIIYFALNIIISTYWRNSILYYLKQMSSFDSDYVRKQYQDKLQSSILNQQILRGQSVPINQQSNNQNAENLRNNPAEIQNPNANKKEEDKVNDINDKSKSNPLFIPRFLEKFSNTFFRKTDPKMTPNEYYQQKQKQKEQKEEQKKQKQQLKKTNKQVNQEQQQSQITQDTKQLQSKKSQSEKHGRSVSSIVFDYSSFQQNSNSKFGFANELLTSLKKGANNIMKNIPFTKGSSYIPSEHLDTENPLNNRNKDLIELQLANTQSDEFNLHSKGVCSNDGDIIEFETEESDRVSTQSNRIKDTKNKEIHMSIIDNPASLPSQSLPLQYNNSHKSNANFSTNNNQNNNIPLTENMYNTNNNPNNNNKSNIVFENKIKQSNDQSKSDQDGQLNTIIEEKSILDDTNNNNNNNMLNIFNNQQFESQQNQKLQNQYKATTYNNNFEMKKGISQIPNNQPFSIQDDDNPRFANQQDHINDLVFSQQNGINSNSHRRFLSAQLNPQMNFNNKQEPNNSSKTDSTNKLPLQPFEEENSMIDSSNQSHIKSQQDQSSMMSCSRMDKSSNTCLVCFDKQPDSVFMDCGHGGVCYDCALEIWKKTGECYLCRLQIVQVLQVDLKSKVYGLIKVISSTQMVQKEVDESEQSSPHQPPLEEIVEDIQEE